PAKSQPPHAAVGAGGRAGRGDGGDAARGDAVRRGGVASAFPARRRDGWGAGGLSASGATRPRAHARPVRPPSLMTTKSRPHRLPFVITLAPMIPVGQSTSRGRKKGRPRRGG